MKCWIWILCSSLLAGNAFGEEPASPRDILSDAQWQRIDVAIDRALAWLIAQQAGDGSFRTVRHGQPGITSLVTMALLSQGHLPGEGPYGRHLQRSLEFVLASQRATGLIARVAQDSPLVRWRLYFEIAV